jgi:hypothetical protein
VFKPLSLVKTYYISLPLSFSFRHPESRLSKMFNGTIPIVLDTLKQHYFIDRDGKLFRHILNFMRTSQLTLPEQFDEYASLMTEAKYYEIDELVKHVERAAYEHDKTRGICDCHQVKHNVTHKDTAVQLFNGNATHDVNNNNNNNASLPSAKSLVNVLNGITSKKKSQQTSCAHAYDATCDSCRILIITHTETSLYISGESALIRNLLPELDEDNVSNHIILNSCKYATKFCLDGSINVHYIEMMERLYDKDFIMEACHGGGFEGQQYNEYVFVKCKK